MGQAEAPVTARFTPGPWELLLDPHGFADVISPTHENWVVAMQIQSSEDARLIAAAPELYEALRDLLANIDRIAATPPYVTPDTDVERLVIEGEGFYQRARAALAKADGRAVTIESAQP